MSYLLVVDTVLTALLVVSLLVAACCAAWVLPWTDAELDATTDAFAAGWKRLTGALPRRTADLAIALDLAAERTLAGR
jgi:hypothetical protein